MIFVTNSFVSLYNIAYILTGHKLLTYKSIQAKNSQMFNHMDNIYFTQTLSLMIGAICPSGFLHRDGFVSFEYTSICSV